MKKSLFAKLTCVVLCLVICLSVFAACGKKDKDDGKQQNTGHPYDTVVMGSATELGGDFRWPGIGGSSAGAADQDIAFLTAGYATMEINKYGAYMWNATAVESHTEEEIVLPGDVKNYKITIKIKDGLTFSDGTPVTSKNYVAYTLVMSTPIGEEAFGNANAGNSLVGHKSFSIYDGTNDGQEVKNAKGNVVGTASKVFKGVRIIDDRTFSIQISEDFYPYYYATDLGAISPNHLALFFGDKTVDVKDDGEGAYLTDAFYEKNAEGAKKTYALTSILEASRFDTTKPFSGPYVITNWNEANREVTLKINDKYLGNFEGQKPHIPTIVYRKIVEETQNAQLKSGELDILEALTGGDAVNGALKIIRESNGGFAQNHYDRAGYGKIQFECDFGPTMFAEVRQAIAYSFDRDEFANTFCGGYGAVVHGPYSTDFQMYKDTEEQLTAGLETYAASVANAKKALEDAGWIYNSKGQPYVAGQAGVDSVRYRKLAVDEYGVDDVNKTYKSIKNEDGIEYKTVKIGEDYYMPLVINWFATTPNPVSDQLVTALKNSQAVKDIGMVIRQETGDFTKLLGEIYRDDAMGYAGTPTYGMFNLATGWNVSTYDYAFNWVGKYDSDYKKYFDYSSNKLSDIYDKDFRYEDHKGLSYDEAMAQSGNKLGMNYLSMAMVYSSQAGDTVEFNKWWVAYILRWNALLPDIPLYSNVYYDVYNSKIVGLETTPFRSVAKSLVYCTLKPQN